MASLLARPPEWRVDVPPGIAATPEPPEFYARALARLLQAAYGAPAGAMSTVDYSDLPDAVWTTIAPMFGLAPSADEIALMAAQAHYYSKDAGSHPYERRPAAAPGVSNPELEPLYRALSSRAVSRPGLR